MHWFNYTYNNFTVSNVFQIASLEFDHGWHFGSIFCPKCENRHEFSVKLIVTTWVNQMTFIFSFLLLLSSCCIKRIDFLFPLVCDIWKSKSHITNNAMPTELKSFSMSITTCINVIMHVVGLLHELSGDNVIIICFLVVAENHSCTHSDRMWNHVILVLIICENYCFTKYLSNQSFW